MYLIWILSYQQHKIHKEDITDEEDWSQDPVGFLNLVEVEVSKDCPQQCENSIHEFPEVTHLKQKEMMTRLSCTWVICIRPHKKQILLKNLNCHQINGEFPQLTCVPNRRYPSWAKAKKTMKNMMANPAISMAHCGWRKEIYKQLFGNNKMLTKIMYPKRQKNKN